MPAHGDRKLIVADGHDAASSVGCRYNLEQGYTKPIYTSWLTPSGNVIVEGSRYWMRYVERFRTARSSRGYCLLRYRGQWEIDSEALRD